MLLFIYSHDQHCWQQQQQQQQGAQDASRLEPQVCFLFYFYTDCYLEYTTGKGNTHTGKKGRRQQRHNKWVHQAR